MNDREEHLAVIACSGALGAGALGAGVLVAALLLRLKRIQTTLSVQ